MYQFLLKQFLKQTGRKPNNLENILLKQKASKQAIDERKIVSMSDRSSVNPNKPILGGKNIEETEEQIRQRLIDQNKKGIESLRNKNEITIIHFIIIIKMNYNGYTVYPDGQILGKYRKILKHRINKKGYHTVNICTKGKHTTLLVHRIVAICYLSNPENKPTVNHNDDDTHNNDLTNLEFMTIQEQNDYKTKMRADNKSGTTGVCYNKRDNRWQAQLRSYGKTYSKYFKTKQEAIDYRKYLEETYKK